MFISAIGSAIWPPRTMKPCTPKEKSPVDALVLPPRKLVTRTPSFMSRSSAAREHQVRRAPGRRLHVELLAVVGVDVEGLEDAALEDRHALGRDALAVEVARAEGARDERIVDDVQLVAADLLPELALEERAL